MRRATPLASATTVFTSNVCSAFFQLKPTFTQEYLESPEFLGETISAWDSNPRLVFLVALLNQLDSSALTCAIKKMRPV